MNEIPPGVIESIRNKKTVLFIGAGFLPLLGFPHLAQLRHCWWIN